MIPIFSELTSEVYHGKHIKLETEVNYELILPEAEETSTVHKLVLKVSEICNEHVIKSFVTRRIHKKVFDCDICGKKYVKKKHFKSHIKNHKELQVRCVRKCKQIFTSRSELEAHKLLNHSGNKQFQLLKCSECADIFKTTSFLESHIRENHTKDGKFSCNKCKFSAINYQSLFSHKIKNHQKLAKDLQCQKCKRGFQTLYDFNQHKKMHKVTCGLCEETFTYKTQKLRHVRDNHGELSVIEILLLTLDPG